MKMFFISCLVLLALISCAKASSLETELEPVIQTSKIVQKEIFKTKLFQIAQEQNICPKLLFSLGLTQWDKLAEKDYEKELELLATLAKHLN